MSFELPRVIKRTFGNRCLNDESNKNHKSSLRLESKNYNYNEYYHPIYISMIITNVQMCITFFGRTILLNILSTIYEKLNVQPI